MKRIAFLAVTIVSLAGCGNDYLNVSPSTSLDCQYSGSPNAIYSQAVEFGKKRDLRVDGGEEILTASDFIVYLNAENARLIVSGHPGNNVRIYLTELEESPTHDALLLSLVDDLDIRCEPYVEE